jgi:hypothetical protein
MYHVSIAVQVFLGKEGNLVGPLQIIKGPGRSFNVLVGIEPGEVVLQASRFVAFGVKGHFQIGQFFAVELAGDVEANLTVSGAIRRWFVGSNGHDLRFPFDEGGSKATESPTGTWGFAGKDELKDGIPAKIRDDEGVRKIDVFHKILRIRGYMSPSAVLL